VSTSPSGTALQTPLRGSPPWSRPLRLGRPGGRRGSTRSGRTGPPVFLVSDTPLGSTTQSPRANRPPDVMKQPPFTYPEILSRDVAWRSLFRSTSVRTTCSLGCRLVTRRNRHAQSLLAVGLGSPLMRWQGCRSPTGPLEDKGLGCGIGRHVVRRGDSAPPGWTGLAGSTERTGQFAMEWVGLDPTLAATFPSGPRYQAAGVWQ